jgi:putative ABC transport system permease protein
MKFLPLVWRNLLRNRLRSLLTAAAIMLAIALVCFLRTMPAGFDAFLEQVARNTRISVHNSAGLVYPLPYSTLQKVRAMPGVVAAVSQGWFGGMVDPDQGIQFPSFVMDADQIAQVYEDYELDPDQVADFQRYRDGAIVGRGTLERMGWRIGDLVTLHSNVFPVSLELRIVGEIPAARAPHLWLRRDYLEQAMLALGQRYDQIGAVWARVDDPARVESLMREIDALFRNSEAETATETEKSFFGNMFGNLRGFVTVILVVTGLVALCTVFIAANTASMSVRERMRELAVFRAIGFGRNLLFGTLLAEATLLSTVAGVLGALASLGLTLAMRAWIGGFAPALGPLSGFVVTNAILVQAIFLALFIGILSGWIPSYGASRRSVTATLREVF